MKRLTKMVQVNDPWFLRLGVPFKKALQDCLVLQHNLIKTEEKKGRESYIFLNEPFFVEFTCNKDFSNIRFKKEPHKKQINPEEIQTANVKFRLAGTAGYGYSGHVVEKCFAIVKGIPIVFWVDCETGEFFGIEPV